jgi:hypothetical protein
LGLVSFAFPVQFRLFQSSLPFIPSFPSSCLDIFPILRKSLTMTRSGSHSIRLHFIHADTSRPNASPSTARTTARTIKADSSPVKPVRVRNFIIQPAQHSSEFFFFLHSFFCYSTVRIQLSRLSFFLRPRFTFPGFEGSGANGADARDKSDDKNESF